MSIHFKGDVRSDGIQPEASHIIIVAHRVWLRHVKEKKLTVTSIVDGVHSTNSLHYSGLAVDLRTNDLPGGPLGDKAKLATARLQDELGNEYQVILEKDHIHVEFDPK